ncbi:MAG: glycerol kinase GlpK [Armatimonadota bacterium]|nr:glycerol kinase GlpK [Armatimonadota bacterium]MDR7485693.1 glycerol kinase GlpK [Armatimonadota bacterium]MDR7533086.1 glycerol kinase GlpK [Armatimonadota bacterium]MDR7535882.1 glycerol kinase GlpK [Armatimonadota bacterium]
MAGASSEYLAAIDQGTTGTRCMLFDLTGRAVASAYREHDQLFPQPGWVEHDPAQIWDRTQTVVAEALAAAPPGHLLAVGITNQRETTVAWDGRTGRPLYNAIVWQDVRTAPDCRALIDAGWEDDVRRRTGLPISTYFSATRIRWLLERVPEVRALASAGHLRLGTIDTWLTWHLTGGPAGGAHVTDPTNASRTLLCNLETLSWDPVLLDRFGVPPGALPAIRPSAPAEPYGVTSPAGPFRARVPVCGILGDQQAALVGQACFAPGEAKNTYGTGSFLLQHVGARPAWSTRGLLGTAAYVVARAGGEPLRAYALEGSIAVTGAAVQWLRDNLGLIASAAETEGLARSVPDAGGVYFVPAFSGLFAPYWDMRARGAIVGLTRYVTKAHLVRATLEAICFQSREVLDAMVADSAQPVTVLKVDGGAAANDFLMQLQADILGVPVVRPAVRETTSLGAAYAAGLGAGAFGSLDALRRLWRADRTFEPAWDAGRRETALRGWRRAVERARDWLEP